MTEKMTAEGVTIPDVKCEECGRYLRPFEEGCRHCQEEQELREQVCPAICDCTVLSPDEIGEILDDLVEKLRVTLRKEAKDFWERAGVVQ